MNHVSQAKVNIPIHSNLYRVLLNQKLQDLVHAVPLILVIHALKNLVLVLVVPLILIIHALRIPDHVLVLVLLDLPDLVQLNLAPLRLVPQIQAAPPRLVLPIQAAPLRLALLIQAAQDQKSVIMILIMLKLYGVISLVNVDIIYI